MLRLLQPYLYVFILFSTTSVSAGQGSSTVIWNFQLEYLQGDEIMVIATARILPGWHLYSTQLPDGGPIPTRLLLDQSPAYIVTEGIRERGKVTKFYSDLYEMDILQYSQQMTLLQKVRLLKPVTFIRGSIEYMTCNDHVCIPQQQDFSIPIDHKRMP